MAKKKQNKKSEDGKVVKHVRLTWVAPEVPRFVYANQMVIQSDPNSTYLSFFTTSPPFLAGEPEQIRREAEKLEEVKAYCVAQVVIPRERLGAFVEAMQSNLSKSLPPDGATGNGKEG